MNYGVKILTLMTVYGLAAFVFFIVSSSINNIKLEVINTRKKLIKAAILLVIFLVLSILVYADMFVKWIPLRPVIQLDIERGVYTIFWLVLGYTVNVVIDFFVWQGIFARGGCCRLPKVLTSSINFIVYLVFFSIVLTVVFGQSVTALLAAGGILAIVVALAIEPVFSNLFSGLSLALGGKIKKGDFIELKVGRGGVVEEVSWRSVKLSWSKYNFFEIIPNSVCASSVVEHYDLGSSSARREVVFSVYKLQLLKTILAQISLAMGDCRLTLASDKEPLVELCSSTIYSYHFTLHVYCNSRESGVDGVFRAIYYRFKQAGIHFSNARDEFELPELAQFDTGIYQPKSENSKGNFLPVLDATAEKVKSSEDLSKCAAGRPAVGAPEVEALVQKQVQTKRIVEALKASPLKLLSETDLSDIAAKAELQTVYYPTRVIIQDDEGDDSLFVIIEGELNTYSLQEDNAEAEMRTLNSGDVFGLKAALLGEKRRITVRPVDCVEAIICEISRETLKPFLENNQELLEQLSELLATREMENLEKSKDYVASKKTDENEDSIKARFLSQLKKLFVPG